jgi:hypothetical protein
MNFPVGAWPMPGFKQVRADDQPEGSQRHLAVPPSATDEVIE